MTKQFLKEGLPSITDRCIQRWEDYRDMQDARQEAKELMQSEMSSGPPQRYGTSYGHNSTLFPKVPETFNDAMKSSENENWTEALLEELKSLDETKHGN